MKLNLCSCLNVVAEWGRRKRECPLKLSPASAEALVNAQIRETDAVFKDGVCAALFSSSDSHASDAARQLNSVWKPLVMVQNTHFSEHM